MFSKAAFCISMSISLTSQVSYLNVFLAPPERKMRRSKQSLCSNRSLTNSVNKKPQRRKLASSSKDHIVIHKCVSISPSPQPDRNSQFWHCHSFASFPQHCLSLPPPLSSQSRREWGGNWSYCMWHTQERKKGGKSHYFTKLNATGAERDVALLLLNNSGNI